MNHYLDFSSKQSLPKVSSFLSLGPAKNSNTSLKRIAYLICELHEITGCLEILVDNEEYSQLLDQPGPVWRLYTLLIKLSDKVQKCLNDAIEEDQRQSKWTHTNVTAAGLLTAQRSVHFCEEDEQIEPSESRTKATCSQMTKLPVVVETSGAPEDPTKEKQTQHKTGFFKWLF